MDLQFLRPRTVNVLLTLLVLSVPLIKERAPLPSGGYEVVVYRPIFLFTAYLQMNDYYPFVLMVGFSLAVYLAVSVVVGIVSKLHKKRAT